MSPATPTRPHLRVRFTGEARDTTLELEGVSHMNATRLYLRLVHDGQPHEIRTVVSDGRILISTNDVGGQDATERVQFRRRQSARALTNRGIVRGLLIDALFDHFATPTGQQELLDAIVALDVDEATTGRPRSEAARRAIAIASALRAGVDPQLHPALLAAATDWPGTAADLCRAFTTAATPEPADPR